MRFRLDEVAAATGGRVVGDPAVMVDGGAIDSRGDVTGRLFVALRAERDGHDFVAGAVEAGAAAVLVDRDLEAGAPAVVAGDTAVALAELGRAARERIGGAVVGVTGSVGKTTVKDLCAAALAGTFRTAASERSFNNELGLPLTLLGAPDGTEVAVLEMGARGPGHVAELCRIGRPTIGVVTAVAAVHTETFGTIDDVARAKGELVEALPSSGTAVLNVDDERVAAMAARTAATVLRVGLAAGADVTAEDVVVDGDLRPAFVLRSPWGSGPVRLEVRGAHQVGNALVAAGAALAAGAPLDAVLVGLAAPPASPWRMAVERAPSGLVVVNDAYNANPTSTVAALRALAALPARRRVAYLGTMAELGPGAEAAHAEVAAAGASLGIEVVAVAEPAYAAASAVTDVASAVAHADDLGLGDGDAVLVKGSRVAGLERLADLLLRA